MKILYNTTFALPLEQELSFLDYVKDRYIPEVLGFGVLSDPRLGRVVSYEPNTDGVSYALQFVAPSQQALDTFLASDGAECVSRLTGVLGTELVGFVTQMELVELD